MNTEKIKTANIAMLVTLCIVSLVIIILLQGQEDGGAPLEIRLKNALNRANTRSTSESEIMCRMYALKNPAVAIMPMHKGICGYQVEIMQRFLNRYCGARLNEDGYWGAATEKAINRYYQNDGGYMSPIMNKYWAFVGNSYVMYEQALQEIVEVYSANLL